MRERFNAVSSFSLRRTSFFASLNGLIRPRLVILPRLRTIAIIGMRWSSASHTPSASRRLRCARENKRLSGSFEALAATGIALSW